MAEWHADFERLVATLKAQPSQRHARDIFWDSDELFRQMTERERETNYAIVDRIIEELPAND